MTDGPSAHQHVYRVAALFALGFAVFVVVRWSLVPADFGVYGFYRGGALADAAALPVKYAGEAVCLDCHDVPERKGSRHEKIKCESCHGPLAAHADGADTVKPRILNPQKLCMQCHAQARGKPASFPQVRVPDHYEGGACAECHKPHRPKIELP